MVSKLNLKIDKVPLREVVSKTTGGGTPERGNPSYWNGGIPWATVKDFKDGVHRLDSTEESISSVGLKFSASNIIPAGTPIVCTRMGVGRIAHAEFPIAINQDLRALFVRDDFDVGYVIWAIDFIRSKIENLAIGSTVKGINVEQLLTFRIYNLSKPEQTKIAEILSTVDRAIKQTEELIAKQQRIKTGLMQDLLTRGIDEHGNLRSEQTHPFKDSSLGRIPVEWEVTQIGNAISLQRGHDITQSELCEGQYPVVSSSGIVGYHYEYTSKGPNVVVGRKGTIGKVHYLENAFWAHDTSLYGTNFFGNNEKYFFYLFTILDLARYGTKSGSPSLNRNDVHPLWVSLPIRIEQDRISTILTEFDRYTNSLASKLEKAKQLKTALMQDLLTGERRVVKLLSDNEEGTT